MQQIEAQQMSQLPEHRQTEENHGPIVGHARSNRSPEEFFGDTSIRFPIKDSILFESKFFWNDRPEDFRNLLKTFKLDSDYPKPFSNMKDFFLRERSLAAKAIEDEDPVARFVPKVREVAKHAVNLELVFRPHFLIPPEHLPSMLEIFNFFCYFYDLIEGPDFDMEELFLCLAKREYSHLAHDIHICLVNMYVKEYVQKQRISFEKENGAFFPILTQIVMKEKHRHVLIRMNWLEFLKEIIIRRLLDEDSVEREVDELLVEVQGLDPEEPEHSASDSGKGLIEIVGACGERFNCQKRAPSRAPKTPPLWRRSSCTRRSRT